MTKMAKTKSSPSHNSNHISTTEEELMEIATIMVDLSDPILRRRASRSPPSSKAVNPFGLPNTWSTKRRRSLPSSDHSTTPTLSSVTDKCGGSGGDGGGTSPATPLSLTFSAGESDCKPETYRKGAKTKDEWQPILSDVAKQNDIQAKQNLGNKDDVISSCELSLNLTIRPPENPYSAANTLHAPPAWYPYQPALIFNTTTQFLPFPLAPRAEESFERKVMLQSRQPLHWERGAVRAMAAQARKNRYQIIKLKSSKAKRLPRL